MTLSIHKKRWKIYHLEIAPKKEHQDQELNM